MPVNELCLSKDRPRTPWNKGKLIGAKPPLRPKHVWSIRTRLMVEGRTRDLAMFNLAIDSQLRGCGACRDNLASGTVFGQHGWWIDLPQSLRLQQEACREASIDWIDTARADRVPLRLLVV